MKPFRIFAIALFLLAATGCVLCVLAYVGWTDLTDNIEVDKTKLVEIPRGSTPEEAVAIVAQAGIIKERMPLRIYIKLTGAGPRIKAGAYYFPSPISPLGVLQKLEEGGQGSDKITVVEGWNRWDIAEEMVHIPSLKLKNTDEVLKLIDDVKLIKDLDPKATSLEGYLFPDTYFVYSTSTPQELIDGMVNQFRAKWRSDLEKPATAAQQSVHDIVTVASIIETEAKLPEERPLIASVIYNRMKLNMTLSVDSTIVYASKLAGKWKNDGKVYQSDIDRDSPYNTRKYHGLPPGPVGNPGLPSMQAALAPAFTSFIYYVRNPARNDGAHNFYTTATDFEKGVQALRDWEQKQKRK